MKDESSYYLTTTTIALLLIVSLFVIRCEAATVGIIERSPAEPTTVVITNGILIKTSDGPIYNGKPEIIVEYKVCPGTQKIITGFGPFNVTTKQRVKLIKHEGDRVSTVVGHLVVREYLGGRQTVVDYLKDTIFRDGMGD